MKVDRLETKATYLGDLDVYQTGQPTETTGEVVAAVRRFRDRDRDRFDVLLGRMGQDVMELQQQLQVTGSADSRTAELIHDYEDCLEQLGVVPIEVRQAIRQIEASGGVAKISGAGALTGPGAGCLLVSWPSGPPPELPGKLQSYRRQEVVLGAEGFRVEELQ